MLVPGGYGRPGFITQRSKDESRADLIPFALEC